MAKELPYFKFHIHEWFTGDITLEDYELQGIFVNICAYYWSKDCDLSKPNLLKKFRGLDDKIEQLVQSDIIKIVGNNVRIHFLNEQYGSKEVQKIANRQNGLLGGRPKKEKTEEKPNGLIFANRNETQTKANHNPNITNIEYSIEDKSIEDILSNNIVGLSTPTPTNGVTVLELEMPPVKNKSVTERAKLFIEKFNGIRTKKIGQASKYRLTKDVELSFKARIADYDAKVIMRAVQNAFDHKFHVENGYQYLTPEYILRSKQIEKYSNMTQTQLNSREELVH